jgi:uncharacterized protein YbjT (DUF2867 family)
MPQSRTVLVTGATGKQGGAVARALLARGHNVVALTRKPESAAAGRLAAAGATVTAGDFRDPASIAVALRTVDAVYAMGTPFEEGADGEVRQGIALVEAARAAGVDHFIYSSVAGANTNAGVPHFDSKFEVEQHLTGAGISFTISAPVAFMDFRNPIFLDGLRAGELRMALPAARPLQYVSVRDVGAFVAGLVERREAVFGRRYEIAGDELAGEQAAAVLSRASGRDVRYVDFPPATLRAHSEDIALMFEWLDRVGYAVDRPALRREFPELSWQSLADWADEQNWRGALSYLKT